MKKALLIAEKPSLRRTIEDVYNKHKSEIPYDITFMEQRGHLLTLKNPDEIDETMKKWTWDNLPFFPKEHGGWQYKVIQEKKVGSYLTSKERYVAIRDELQSGSYDFVIHAGDPDQEGQLLVNIVLSALKNSLPVKRYWSNDTTESKVLEALKNLKDNDSDPMLVNLLKAAYGRQHTDYLFGMNLSRAATIKMGTRVAVGRVKTPILAIVCKREDEITNFVPSTCYGVKADYSEDFEGQLYDESRISSDDDGSDKEKAGMIWFDSKEEAEKFIESLPLHAKVTKYETKRVESYAPKLFKLATAQIAAGKMGYTSSQTLQIIQGLYEKGFLSYPRTDCEYVSSGENFGAMLKSAACVPELQPFVSSIDTSVIGKVKGTKKWVNDKKLTESGHSALVPTTMKPDFASLSPDEQKIYTMICRQFVAIFLPPLVQDKTELIASVGDKTFKSTGKKTISPGYSKIFNTVFTDNIIPKHKEGDTLSIVEYSTLTKTTTCPKRFTDADLIAVCENPVKWLNDESLKKLGKDLKIGTPATRASIIEQLISKDKYLQRKKAGKAEHIVPTDVGFSIYRNIKDCDICKVDLTGEMELLLEEVREGTLHSKDMENQVQEYVISMMNDIKKADIKPVARAKVEVIGKCPDCGGDLMSSSKGFYCSNYKEGCKTGSFKQICDSTVTNEEFLKMLNGEHIKKQLKKGNYVWVQELRYDPEEKKIQFVEAEKKTSEYSCPNCGSEMTDDGRTIKCVNGDFTFWKTSFGKVLTDEQIKSFFETGDTGLIKGLKFKSGKTGDAHIILNDDRTGTSLKFPPRKG